MNFTCNISSHEMPEFIISSITSCGGVLLTVLSTICIATSTAMDPYHRSVLLSFSIANVFGTAMLGYDTTALLCYDEKERLSFVMNISVMLSLSHLILLMIAEYIIVTSHRKRQARDFAGLITVSWIISITTGMMHVFSRQYVRVAFILLLLLSELLLAVSYLVILRKHRRRKQIMDTYRRTCLRERSRRKVVTRCWLPLFGIIIFSYTGCTALWVVNELREGMFKAEDNPVLHSTSLIVYSMNFYFPSVISMYIKSFEVRSRRSRSGTFRRVQSSYRLRDMS